MRIERTPIPDITIPPDRARSLDAATVARMAESIKALGLKTPITLRYDTDTDKILLVAGLHRLEAGRSLGWHEIDAVYEQGSADDARMWEIAENLHRADLSAVERAEHIEEWRKLSAKVANNSPPSGGVQPSESGVRKAARELGVSHKTVQNAAKIAALPPEVKEQAKAENWSQTRALAAASPSKPAPAIKNAFESEEDWRRSLFTVWNRGAQEWRERAIESLDPPVFDNTRAA